MSTHVKPADTITGVGTQEDLSETGKTTSDTDEPMTEGSHSESDEQMEARPVDQGDTSDTVRDEPREHCFTPRLPPPSPSHGDEVRLLTKAYYQAFFGY